LSAAPGHCCAHTRLSTVTGAALGLAVTLAPWLGSLPVTTALAIPAGALTAYGELRQTHGSETTIWVAELLLAIAVLAALSGGSVRLPRSWLWLPGAFRQARARFPNHKQSVLLPAEPGLRTPANSTRGCGGGTAGATLKSRSSTRKHAN
jgi:hypothetical protein